MQSRGKSLAGRDAKGERPRCGLTIHPRKPDERPCPYPAGYGTAHPGYGHCIIHDKPKQARAIMTQMVEDLEPVYGKAKETNPWLFLQTELNRTNGHIAWLGMQIAQEEGEDALYELTSTGLHLHPRMNLYVLERRHGASLSKQMIAGGIAEREVRLMEQESHTMAQILLAVVSRLNLSPEDQARVPGLLRDELLRQDALEAGIIEGE